MLSKVILILISATFINLADTKNIKLTNDQVMSKLRKLEKFTEYCNDSSSILYSIKDKCALVDSASNAVQIASNNTPKVINLGANFKAVVFKKNNFVFINIKKKGDDDFKLINRFFFKEENNKNSLYRIPLSCQFESQEVIPIVEKCNEFKLKGKDFIKKLVEVDIQVKDKNGVLKEQINKKESELQSNLTEQTGKIADGIAECAHKYNNVYNFQIECLVEGVKMDHSQVIKVLESYANEIREHFKEQDKDYIVTIDQKSGKIIVTKPTVEMAKIKSSNALV